MLLHMPDRVALYHRVSTVDQTLDAARAELKAAAKRYGFKVQISIEETGSGANNNRPGLVRVLEAARRGQVEAVLVWKLDRFGRSALDLLTNLRQLDSAGVRFIATSQGIDIRPGSDAMSRLLLTMLSAIAEFERDLIVDRTRLGLQRARRRGQRLGRPPVAQPPARDVRALKADGKSWAAVAKHLGCSVWAARQAVKKGGRKTATQTSANREPSSLV
jgi:DNA invertase Pin-like site-specific DNA recombinase